MKDIYTNNKKLIIISLLIIIIGVVVAIIVSTGSSKKSSNKVFHCKFEHNDNAYSLLIDKYMYIENDTVTKKVSNIEYKFNVDIPEDKYKQAEESIMAQLGEKLNSSNIEYDVKKGENSIIVNLVENELDTKDEDTIYLKDMTLEEKIEIIKADSEKLGGECSYE